jgi:hypothetical protein
MKALVLTLFMLETLVGCASYEYQITEPAEFANRVGSKQDIVFQREPLEYRPGTAENRLVMFTTMASKL